MSEHDKEMAVVWAGHIKASMKELQGIRRAMVEDGQDAAVIEAVSNAIHDLMVARSRLYHGE